jgi:hypothetical protein
MDSTSNPSRAFRATVRVTMMTCRVVIGDLAMISRGSVVFTMLYPSVVWSRLGAVAAGDRSEPT